MVLELLRFRSLRFKGVSGLTVTVKVSVREFFVAGFGLLQGLGVFGRFASLGARGF